MSETPWLQELLSQIEHRTDYEYSFDGSTLSISKVGPRALPEPLPFELSDQTVEQWHGNVSKYPGTADPWDLMLDELEEVVHWDPEFGAITAGPWGLTQK